MLGCCRWLSGCC